MSRWYQFSVSEQLANIGSEVGRVVMAKERGDINRHAHAYRRALDLIDATLQDPRWAKTPRARELQAVRELLVDYGSGANSNGSTKESWDAYFLPINYVARADR